MLIFPRLGKILSYEIVEGHSVGSSSLMLSADCITAGRVMRLTQSPRLRPDRDRRSHTFQRLLAFGNLRRILRSASTPTNPFLFHAVRLRPFRGPSSTPIAAEQSNADGAAKSPSTRMVNLSSSLR